MYVKYLLIWYDYSFSSLLCILSVFSASISPSTYFFLSDSRYVCVSDNLFIGIPAMTLSLAISLSPCHYFSYIVYSEIFYSSFTDIRFWGGKIDHSPGRFLFPILPCINHYNAFATMIFIHLSEFEFAEPPALKARRPGGSPLLLND